MSTPSILTNTKVAQMMSHYLILIKSSDYQKIESFVENNGGPNCTAIPIAADLVRQIRGFVAFSMEGVDETYNMINWYAKNNIANLNIDVIKGGAVSLSGEQSILQKWESFVDLQLPIPLRPKDTNDKSAVATELWFFSNAAKSYLKIRELLYSIVTDDDRVQSDPKATRVLSDRELTGNLRASAQNILYNSAYMSGNKISSMSASSGQKTSVALLKNICDGILSLYPPSFKQSEYSVLKYTRFAGSWTKTSGVGKLETLKMQLSNPITQSEAAGGLLGDLYIEALNGGLSDLDSLLSKKTLIQVQLIQSDPMFAQFSSVSVTVDVKFDEEVSGAVKATSVATNPVRELRMLAISKALLYEYNRKILKPLIEWQCNSKIAKASAAVAHATTGAVLRIVGGVAGFCSEPTRELFDRIAKSQDDLFQAAEALPVSIQQARIEQIQLDLKRLSELTDTLITNYTMLMGIQNKP